MCHIDPTTVTITRELATLRALVVGVRFISQGRTQILAGIKRFFWPRLSRMGVCSPGGSCSGKSVLGPCTSSYQVKTRLRLRLLCLPWSNLEIHFVSQEGDGGPSMNLEAAKRTLALVTSKDKDPAPRQMTELGKGKSSNLLVQLKCSQKIQRRKENFFHLKNPKSSLRASTRGGT